MQPAASLPDLVRRLAGPAGGAAPPAGAPLGERLAEWLGWADAIGLAATLADEAPAGQCALPGAAVAAADRADKALAALRRRMAREAAVPQEAAADAAELKRHLRERQRVLDDAVAALRQQVRQSMVTLSPRLRQLARLDAALEAALTGRERVALGAWPALAERAPAQDPVALLAAELELRLQPVEGLVAALREEADTAR